MPSIRQRVAAASALVALVAVSVALEARADRTVEDWVGTWRGAATWKGCTAPGADALSVAVTWQGGVLWIDGAALYEGLGPLAVDVRDSALVVDVDDLRVELTRGRGGKAKLALTTAARCTATATVARDTTGIAACDDVVALATAAASCGVEVDDDPADEVDEWRALPAKGRKARARAGAACEGRATALRERLVAAECLPSAHDAGELAECREVWRHAARIQRCERIPAERKRATLAGVAEMRRSLRTWLGTKDGAERAREHCKEAATLLADTAKLAHCP